MVKKELVIGNVYDLSVHSNVLKSTPVLYLGQKKHYSYSQPRHMVAFRSLITGEVTMNTFLEYRFADEILVIKNVKEPKLEQKLKEHLDSRLKRAGMTENA